jgi:ketosteroid isomerase-like protein
MRFPLNILPVLVLAVSATTYPTSSTYCPSNPSTTTYPNKCEIFHIFDHLNHGNFTAFFENVALDVEWTIMGTHPLAGVYNSQKLVVTDAIERLGNVLKSGGSTNLISIVGGETEEWSVQEIHALGVCKNGELLHFDARYRSLALLPPLIADKLINRPQVRQRLLLGDTLEHWGQYRTSAGVLRFAFGHQGDHGERVPGVFLYG